MATTRKNIDDFLAHERLAFVGLSTDDHAFSRRVSAVMRENGYDVVPVNPNATEIDGSRCYHTVGEISPPVDAALIMTSPEDATKVLRQCNDAGIHYVWLHRGAGPGSVSREAIDYCALHEMNVVPGECPLMFVGNPPEAAHRAHGMLKKLSGTHPASADGLNAALVLYGVLGWALCGATMYAGIAWLGVQTAMVVHAVAAPLIFAALSRRYYRRRAHPSALATAATFALTVIALDLFVVALLIERSFEMFSSVAGTWLPWALILLSSWFVGRRARRRHH